MNHVRVTLTAHGREAEVHPMYDVLANATFVERATALQWNFTGDALGILHYVEGDADAFAEAAAEATPVLEYELEPADEDAFYAYVRDATTPAMRDLFEPMTYEGVVVVPPVVFREDGTVAVSVFGPAAEIQTAFDGVPDPVEVTVQEVSGLGAVPGAVETRLSERQREAIDVALELGCYTGGQKP